MSDSSPSSRAPHYGAGRSKFRGVIVPYVLALGSQLPLSLVYLKNIWQVHEHFRLFPIALLAFGFFLYVRWPRTDETPFRKDSGSNLFFALAVVFGLGAALFVSPWLSFASVCLCATSLLWRTHDEGSAQRLASVAIPILVLLHLPLGFDFELVQGDILVMDAVNLLSAALASDTLDLLSYVHNQAGTVLEFPDRVIDSTRIGNGGFSVFSLLILTAAMVAYLRRPFFRGLLLLISAFGWAILLEAGAIVLAVLGYESFDQDWFSAQSLLAIELFSLILGILLILATDQFLTFLFGPVDITSIDESATYQYGITRFWNRFIAGHRQSSIDINDKQQVAREARRTRPVTSSDSRILWVGAIILAITILPQIFDVSRAFSMANRAENQRSENAESKTLRDLLPEQVADWTRVDFQTIPREFESAFTAVQYQWSFQQTDDPWVIIFALRGPFPGCSYPTREFVNRGWQIDGQRRTVETLSTDNSPPWQFVLADLHNQLAETSHLAYCHIDQYGDPIAIPSTWNHDFVNRCIARLSRRVRPRIVDPVAMEITAHAESIGPLTENEKQQVQQLFLAARDVLQQRIADGSFRRAVAFEMESNSQ